MAAVKIGVSRQVVIPKKIHDTLGLAPGDYLEVAVERGKVVMTPKALVDKRLEKRLIVTGSWSPRQSIGLRGDPRDRPLGQCGHARARGDERADLGAQLGLIHPARSEYSNALSRSALRWWYRLQPTASAK